MAYSDFSNKDLVNNFGIKFRADFLFKETVPIAASDWLTTTLERAIKMGFSNEKSRSERLVAPVLMELSALNKHQFTVYSGENLAADETVGLNGECDFMLSFSNIIAFVTAPIFCITEAKKQDIEKGLIQCAAQLIGAKLFNEKEQKPLKCLYGCSTTGIEWWFLKLEDNTITIDRNRYYLQSLPKLLGALQGIVEEQRKGKI